jgi:hypothetical protein
MNITSYFILGATVVLLAISITGCGSGQSQTTDSHSAGTVIQEQRQANFAKLNEEDRSLAEAQGYCAVSGEPLGSMGPPLKLMVNDQPAFVCCKGCEKKAMSHPDQTLAKVAELKAKVKSEGAR